MEDNSEYFKYFVYDPLVTTGLRWRLDMYGGIHYSALLRKAGDIAGSPVYRRGGGQGGCIVQINHKRFWTHRLIWEMFNGPIPEGMVIDHLNRNNWDNRIENLACKTLAENNRNASKNRRNKTGKTGVQLHPSGNPRAVVATWYENGKQYRKYFSIRKFGLEKAMEHAKQYREDKIKHLNDNGANYTENHGE